MNKILPAALLLMLATGCTKKKPSEVLSTDSWISSFSLLEDSLAQVHDTPGLDFSTKDAAGNYYLNVTTRPTSSESVWKIMRSTDQGETWSVVETSTSNHSFGYQIEADALGNIFSVGGESSNGSDYTGIVRKFDGTTWSVVKSFQTEPGISTLFYGAAVDSDNNIYVLGSGDVSTPVSSKAWVVLKSTDHGATWSQTNTFIPEDNSPCYGTRLLATSSGDIYASGYCAFGHGESFIRKSSDQGVTWSTVYEVWNNRVESLAEWNNGIIFATNAQSGPNKGHVKVFHSQDDFQHLTELYDSGPFAAGYVGTLAVDARGYIYLSATYTDDSGGNRHGSIVASHDGEWETIELLNFTAGAPYQWMGAMFFNDRDQVLYSGAYTDSGTTTLRIYRANLISNSPWVPAALGDGSDKVSPIPAGAKIIYATSAFTDGFLGATPSAAVVAADAMCNADPYKPTYAAGSFKALLVNSARVACTTANCSGGAAEHTDWVLAPSKDYVTRSGKAVGTTNAEGLFTAVSNPLGTYILTKAWTGLRVDPSTDWTVDDWTCGQWTVNVSDWGTAWDPTASDFSSMYLGGNWPTCDETLPLICAEQ